MVDTKFIGKKFPPSEPYKITEDEVKAYAKAVGDENPFYVDNETATKSKYGGIIAPLMFAVVYCRDTLGAVITDEELDISFAGLVHGEQEFEFFAPVKVGDEITTEGEIENIYEKKEMQFVVVLMTSKNQKGSVVSKGRYTFIIR